jgi:hypothetical protein
VPIATGQLPLAICHWPLVGRRLSPARSCAAGSFCSLRPRGAPADDPTLFQSSRGAAEECSPRREPLVLTQMRPQAAWSPLPLGEG